MSQPKKKAKTIKGTKGFGSSKKSVRKKIELPKSGLVVTEGSDLERGLRIFESDIKKSKENIITWLKIHGDNFKQVSSQFENFDLNNLDRDPTSYWGSFGPNFDQFIAHVFEFRETYKAYRLFRLAIGLDEDETGRDWYI